MTDTDNVDCFWCQSKIRNKANIFKTNVYFKSSNRAGNAAKNYFEQVKRVKTPLAH